MAMEIILTSACGRDVNDLLLEMDSLVDGTFTTTCAVCMTTNPLNDSALQRHRHPLLQPRRRKPLAERDVELQDPPQLPP